MTRRQKKIEPLYSYDAFHIHTRSGNNKTNMVRQRQDKTKLNHVHLLSCQTVVGWEKGRLPRWPAGTLTQGGKVLQETVSAFPSPTREFGLSLSCHCLPGVTSSHSVNTLPGRHLCLDVVLLLNCCCDFLNFIVNNRKVNNFKLEGLRKGQNQDQ